MTETTHTAGQTIWVRVATTYRLTIARATIAKVTPKGYRMADGTLVNQYLKGGDYQGEASPDEVARHMHAQAIVTTARHVRDIANRIDNSSPSADKLTEIGELARQMMEVLA